MSIKVTKPREWENPFETEPEMLWSQLQMGNKEAVSKLFCRYYSKLYNYGYNIIPDRELVRDCIQELFLTLWNKREGINEPHSVKAYLISSFRRLIFRKLNKHRNRKKRNQVYTDNFLEESCNVEELMVHCETKKELKQKLEEAIDSLSDRQKESIYLKFYQGLTTDEISIVMEVNKQSVYNHVSVAISNMQNYIEVGS
ncbi:sigma-70 family RNA polymerase sigma factor [Aliifodinibius sp. S!AR15-10]|uniref:RNA polymerase sigma factor n=1 Tax=Aliifodinibius sp. S!AR15-10 TaxID=2950437 RepID=UPI0028564EC8|nr:sigma-70 family RNA polymerase sigma factor [Aliifodinibius sp. S!AR15-10]MDR8392708.1 sigma-70 family RNA polymerase sigma factor [Aliifodinibius sp. S!AR15-10]